MFYDQYDGRQHESVERNVFLSRFSSNNLNNNKYILPNITLNSLQKMPISTVSE